MVFNQPFWWCQHFKHIPVTPHWTIPGAPLIFISLDIGICTHMEKMLTHVYMWTQIQMHLHVKLHAQIHINFTSAQKIEENMNIMNNKLKLRLKRYTLRELKNTELLLLSWKWLFQPRSSCGVQPTNESRHFFIMKSPKFNSAKWTHLYCIDRHVQPTVSLAVYIEAEKRCDLKYIIHTSACGK